MAVLEQDRCIDIDRSTVVALGVGERISGIGIDAGGSDLAVGQQAQGVVTGVAGDNRRIDVDALAGADLHIVRLQSGGNCAGSHRSAARCAAIGLDIHRFRIKQPFARLLPAARRDLGIGSHCQLLAGCPHHTTTALARGAGAAGELSLAVAPYHHPAAIALAVRFQLCAVGHRRGLGGRLAALALEAAADQHLAAR